MRTAHLSFSESPVPTFPPPDCGTSPNFLQIQHDVNRAEATMMGGGELMITSAPNTVGGYQWYQGYGGSSVTYENKPCQVCGTKGKRREWIYDGERNKMVKGRMVECDACQGRGWQAVSTTHYNTYPFVVNDVYTPPSPSTPYVEPYIPATPYTPPTVAPFTPPFYGSTTQTVGG